MLSRVRVRLAAGLSVRWQKQCTKLALMSRLDDFSNAGMLYLEMHLRLFESIRQWCYRSFNFVMSRFNVNCSFR